MAHDGIRSGVDHPLRPFRLFQARASLCLFSPEQFHVVTADSDAVYRWNTRMVHNHFCSACGCDLYADSPDFKPDGSWDGKTRRIAVNARLLDDFEAAGWPVNVIDGKHLW